MKLSTAFETARNRFYAACRSGDAIEYAFAMIMMTRASKAVR